VFLHFPVRSLLSSLLFLNFLFFHLLPWPCPFLSFFYLSVCFEQRVEQVRLWASQQRKNRGAGQNWCSGGAGLQEARAELLGTTRAWIDLGGAVVAEAV
jgi:hypothetical protein